MLNYLSLTVQLILRYLLYFLSAFLLIFSAGCSVTKELPEGEKLYTGATIKIRSADKVENKKELKSELKSIIQPKPNKTFLGFPLKLAIYNMAGTPEKKKGFKHWLKYKVGEPPVLFSSVNPEVTENLLLNYLQNNGYFDARVNSQVITKNKKAKVVYTATLKSPYIIQEIYYPDSSALEKEISNLKESSLLEKGNAYDLEKLKSERQRISEELKNKGYYFFSPEFLLFKVDTSIGNRKAAVYLEVKSGIDPDYLSVYRLNHIFIYPSFSLPEDTIHRFLDRFKEQGYYYAVGDSLFRPKAILRAVFLRSNDVYSRKNHNLTLYHLVGLGVFKFVNIRFKPVDSLNSNKLNAYIYLTPMLRKSLRLELSVVSKSNNFAGPGIGIGFKNRNFFNGAELFVFNLSGNFETQISGKGSGLYSYELGGETNLYIPRFILPFNVSVSKRFVPQTRFQLSYRFLNRVNFYRLNTFNAIYGYQWKETLTKQHEVNPVVINFFNLPYTTASFDSTIRKNPLLEKSFQKQFILGCSYSFTFNSQQIERKNAFYFNGNIDFSGNLIQLLQLIAHGEKKK